MNCRVCERKAEAKGLCHRHYEKLRITGTLDYRPIATGCSRPGCDRPHAARGLCNTHYRKLATSGTFEYIRTPGRGWSRSEWHRYSRYGVTPEDYAATLRFQEGACAICKQPLPTDARKIHQDHDHATGEPRGLLCRECNLVLAAIEGRRVSAQAFADYLDDWKLYHAEPEQDMPAVLAALREEAARRNIE